MKTRIFPLAGVTDDSNERGVAYLQDFILDGSSLKTLNMPELQAVDVPRTARYIWSYRDKFYFSENRRSYAARHSVLEEIYYSEAGSRAMQIIAGKELKLGIERPLEPPVVEVGIPFAPGRVKGEMIANAGTKPKGTTRYLRVAYRSGGTIMTASSSASATTLADKDGIKWTWQNPTITDVVIDAIVVAVGNAGGSERIEIELPPTATEWQDSLESDGNGEQISLYDQRSRVRYVYTLERSIAGVVDESGPSPLSPVVTSSGKNIITFRPNGENLGPRSTWDSLPGFTMGDDSVLEHKYGIEKIEKDATSGKWIFTLYEEHLFVDGEYVSISNMTGDPFGKFVEILRHPDDPKSIIIVPEATGTVPAVNSSMQVFRTVTAGIKSLNYDANAGMIVLNLAEVHTWKTGDDVQFVGFKDLNWDEGVILASTSDNTKVWITNKSAPAKDEGKNPDPANPLFVRRPMSVMQLSDNMPEGMGPSVGTILFMNLSGVEYSGEVLGIFGKKVILGGCYTGAYVPQSTDSVEYVLDNGHIGFRNLYRVGAGGDSAGGTSEIRRVARIPYRKRKYADSIPDASLGDVLPTYYSSALGFVVYDAPPLGIDHLTLHQDMLFATSGHDLLWTDRGFPNAWASVFRHSFNTKIMGLRSYNGALIVFCQDRLYRVDGGDPTMLSIHPTDATEGAISHAIVEANSRLYYISGRGLMEFNGAGAHCLTDQAIPGEFWRQTSVYRNITETAGSFLVGAPQSQGYQSLLDAPVKRVDGLGKTRDNYVAENIRAFAWDGKIVIYWSDPDKFQGSGACVIDTTRQGAPVQFTGIKIMDAHVDEFERPYVLIGQPDPPTMVKAIPENGVWDMDQFVTGDPIPFLNARAPHLFLLASLPPAYGVNQWGWISLRVYIPGMIDSQSARGTCTVEFPDELAGYGRASVMIPGEQFPTISGSASISVGLPYGGQIPIPLGMYSVRVKAKLDNDPEEYVYNLRIKVVPFYQASIGVVSDVLVDPGMMIRQVKLRVAVAHDDAVDCTLNYVSNIFKDTISVRSLGDNRFDIIFNTYENVEWSGVIDIEDAETSSRVLDNAGDWVRPEEGDLRASRTQYVVSNETHGSLIPVRLAGVISGDTLHGTVVPHGNKFYIAGGIDLKNPNPMHFTGDGYSDYLDYFDPGEIANSYAYDRVTDWTDGSFELLSLSATFPYSGECAIVDVDDGTAITPSSNTGIAAVKQIDFESMKLKDFASLPFKVVAPIAYSSGDSIIVSGGASSIASTNVKSHYVFDSSDEDGEYVTTYYNNDPPAESFSVTVGTNPSGSMLSRCALIATPYDLMDPISEYKSVLSSYYGPAASYSNMDFITGIWRYNVDWAYKPDGTRTLMTMMTDAVVPTVNGIYLYNGTRLS